MVGKIKHVRQKLHQEAVKLHRPAGFSGVPGSGAQKPHALELHTGPSPPPVHGRRSNDTQSTPAPGPGSRPGYGPAPGPGSRPGYGPAPGPGSRPGYGPAPGPGSRPGSFPSGVFADTNISAEALVQTLKLDPPPDVTTPVRAEEKRIQSKKEKMKERRERWLSKISSIKQAKEQQAAEAQRQATPIVGDMRPLADALPELYQLITPPSSTPTARRKSRKNKVPVKRPEPTDFSQMKHSQKRKLLETESSRFSAAVKTLSAKMNPLADIGEQLRKRMRQEEEQGPS
ncbi:ribosome biogenesis protein SLX9 homolog [Embiotoca jacksoni]|uniref:ribosome biogenesis protein SLX9 homolog n=1 Tax=Embiotoca jacksoni TaxID=100190 RepID=UPI0037048327